jgi:hypothetical protein
MQAGLQAFQQAGNQESKHACNPACTHAGFTFPWLPLRRRGIRSRVKTQDAHPAQRLAHGATMGLLLSVVIAEWGGCHG